MALANLGNIYRAFGRPDDAEAQYQRCLDDFRRLGDRSNEGVFHANIGEVERHQGRRVSAASHFRRALRIAEELGDAAAEANILTHLGLIASDDGDLGETLQLNGRRDRHPRRVPQPAGGRP